MDKQIPLYFDAIVLDSPIQEIQNTNSNISRLKVGVFTKYKNRNGSYITEEYAQHLIESATRGNVPVVGFFDPETQTWASHTGPALANGYGYIESFLGWEPFTDTDGVTRDYAVFSVILFTEYFEEARKVLGQNQSMELDSETIDGDWARFDDEEYFVYTKGDMKGFCIIGAHEPCFSVSSFFSKNEEAYEIQYEKFSSLLSDLKTVVEEAEKFDKGGEQPMDILNDKVVDEATPLGESDNFQAEEVVATEEVPATEEVFEQEQEPEQEANVPDFEALQQQFDELQVAHQELQQNYEAAQARINELEAAAATAAQEFETLTETNKQLESKINEYASQIQENENTRKEELVNQYSELVDVAEISNVRENINNFSYDELKAKLAISFAEKKIAEKKATDKVLLPEPPKDSFAALMKNYKK